MYSTLNGLRNAFMLESGYQQLGAWIMLLSSFAFFNILTWTHFLLVVLPFQVCIAGCSCGFILGAVLAHGIQKTTPRFVEIFGINVYINGWTFIVNGIFVANSYLEAYFSGIIGVFIVFVGLVLYFMLEKNPTPFIIEIHILVGSFLMYVGAIVFTLVYFRIEIDLFHLVQIRPLRLFWGHKAIIAVLVGNGLLLISIFLHLFSTSVREQKSN